MGDEIVALADSTRELLRELAAVRAEGEALRKELEAAWGDEVLELDDEDLIPTLIPGEERDTLLA